MIMQDETECSFFYPTVVRMFNKDFVVVSCSAVMRSNNVMS